MSSEQNDFKTRAMNTASDVGIGIAGALWLGWMACSLGTPFMASAYATKLDKSCGTEDRYGINHQAVIWSLMLGPFAIPVSIAYAGRHTWDCLTTK